MRVRIGHSAKGDGAQRVELNDGHRIEGLDHFWRIMLVKCRNEIDVLKQTHRCRAWDIP
jgi:hypothetical protein